MGAARIAIVAGSGELPRIVAATISRTAETPPLLVLPGCEAGWMEAHPRFPLTLENYGAQFAGLKESGIDTVVLAGGVERPTFRIPTEKSQAEGGLDLLGGDDRVLRGIIAAVERMGLRVAGAHEVVPDVLHGPGILTRTDVDEFDRIDAARAAAIVRALGSVDAGQAAVVAGKICLAVETISGTDAMLSHVANMRDQAEKEVTVRCGVLYKSPKVGQDWRVDLPAIGPKTVALAATAGLAGIAIEANGVLVLDRSKTVERADALGLFIWSRQADP